MGDPDLNFWNENDLSDMDWNICIGKGLIENDWNVCTGKDLIEMDWNFCIVMNLGVPYSVDHDEKDHDDKDHDDKENEHVPWWKCCCPYKKSEKGERKESRKTSVAEAEDQLKSLDISARGKISSVRIMPGQLPLTFVPDFIIHEIFKEDALNNVPYAETSNVVLLMADVCGFTRLCESYCQRGVTGIENLTSVLNGFMSALAALLIEGGGDILNFAGDAFLVQFVSESTDSGIENAAVKALECAMALQTHECLQTRNLDGTLKVKIGIAMGEVSIWCLGTEQFLLFVAAGPTLPNVQTAEDMCSPGDIIVDNNVFKALRDVAAVDFDAIELKKGFAKIVDYAKVKSSKDPEPDRLQLFELCNSDHISKAKLFLLPSLRGLRSADELQYVSELTTVTVLFIALLNVNVAQPKLLDKTFSIILESVMLYEGVLNKMLLFDKGCTFLVAFGLPGHKHSNDAARGICCAEDIIAKLQDIYIFASIGISSGTCYCGIVGHPQRQEYTVIGNRVNMAARMMVIYSDQPIALNVDTYHLSRDELGDVSFVELPARKMKGIDRAGAVYAYRRQLASTKTSSITTFGFVEDSNLYGSDIIKEQIQQCVIAMSDDKQREIIKKKTLLPIVIIKGHAESGKSYISFFTADCALASGYKFAACCAIASLLQEPFSVISRIIRRMLGMTMLERKIDRENLLVSLLPSSVYPDLYLLNHLFMCEFPVTPFSVTAGDFKTEKISKLLCDIIHEFCNNKYMLICIDNADFIDDQSWDIFLRLAEEEKVLIVFNLSMDFKESSKASSTILLKAYKDINADTIQEDMFAPVLCWFLGVNAVHTGLFIYLKETTGSKIALLKEISLSTALLRIIKIVPLNSIDEMRLKKEFFVETFQILKKDKPLACDLRSGIDLKKVMIPTNINDAVKESMNNLSIQDRLLLKRAAVLGSDFDLHSLEAISTGMKRSEVLQSVMNLLSSHIFSSACALENKIEVASKSSPTIALDKLNICFCYNIYLKSQLKHLDALNWAIGPYHRLIFRTSEFRSCMLGYMTKEQIYSMRMLAADNLETNATECATCKSARTEGIDAGQANRQARRYSTVFKICVCLKERPRIYSEISQLYSALGMIFLPIYFKKKAAQTANYLNFPIQAICYVRLVSKKMPHYWLMSDDEKIEEEAYFDPIVLDISLKITMAKAFLLLGDVYQAVSLGFECIKLFKINYICFYGAYKPSKFKDILSKFKLLHAEYVVRIIGLLARAHMEAHEYNAARSLLKFEYYGLKAYPIDFVQVLRHMASMYWFKYLVHEGKQLGNLETNIFRLCRERLRNFEQLIDLIEIETLGNSYAVIVEVNLVLAQFERCEKIASEAVRILQLNFHKGILPLIKIFLFHLHFHNQNYENCSRIVFDLFKMTAVSTSRKYRCLAFCCYSMFLTKSLIGIPKIEIHFSYDKCNTFATNWRNEACRMLLPKELIFYVSVVMARWCLYSDKKSGWIDGKVAFIECYKLAKTYQNMIERLKFDYWTISGLMLLLELEIRIMKRRNQYVSVDKNLVHSELDYLKDKIKNSYPIYLKEYKSLATEVQTMV